jgi:hypothetical protein
VFLLAQHAARAAGFEISWQAPASCGTRADFEAGVSRIVGKPLAELGSSWASANVVIVATSDAWRLRVRVVSAGGTQRERDVVTATCREAVEAAEIIVATNLSEAEPGAAESPSAQADSVNAAPSAATGATSAASAKAARARAQVQVQPKPVAPPQRAGRAADSAATANAARTPLTVALGARVGVEPWLLPSATSFASLALAVESERLRAELLLSASYPEAAAVVGTEGGRARAQLSSAGGLGCYGGRASAFELWGCVGGELGRFTVAGQNLIHSQTQHEFWAAGLAQLEAAWPATRALSLLVGAQGMATSRRIHVVEAVPQSANTVKVYSTSPADIRPWLGLEGRF